MELHTFYAALSGDLSAALSYTGSKENLLEYLRMLPSDGAVAILNQRRLTPQEIRSAAHQLKGVAGILGLTRLHSLAEAVQRGMAEQDGIASTRLAELEACLGRTLRYIRALETPQAHLRPSDRGQWARILQGMPGDVCVIQAETGKVVWGARGERDGSAPSGEAWERAADCAPEVTEAVWDAAWLGKAGCEQGLMVWPCQAGYAFCFQPRMTEPDVMSILGHDVRAPLQVIRSMTELAQCSGDAQQVSDALERIDESGRMLEQMLGGYTGAGEGQQLESFHLTDVLRRLVKVMGEDAERKGLRLQMTEQVCQHRVRANRSYLSRAVINLMGNAIKNTEPGGWIHLSCKEAAPGCYEVTVKDSGAGMSASFVHRALEPWRKFNPSAQGMGLGLHIVNNLIRRMGGEVCISSSPGSGTAVRLRVPMAAAEEGRQASLAGVRVLLVDDHTLSAQACAAMLESMGAGVTLAHSGAEALRQAKGQDCVLMDIRLPDMSGCEAAQRLHMRYRAQELPILAFTGDASAEIQERATACGMQGVLVKPLGREAMAGAILAQLHR